ncbi:MULTISPECIES: thiol reductant ABC exporter subunit CydC [unclassified Actinomyces]|uniref:thiol reductant ABC exporter subunit CydC n=1 Tax=unclassified Actinomyces TaxID=2609248 RepID=UPI000D59AD5B|nr:MULTISPECIES: thiol reductant ABC exporter subunit CydC [unclassified Actinomyces]RAX22940.1 thiol reductant ABC exporter subunit CydC [Actinomyces sp. Z3]
MSAALTTAERRALRRAVTLLDLDGTRFAASVIVGSLGLASAVGLSAVAAWMIARAAQASEVAALGVAPVAVRLFGISRSVMRYCERLLSHDTALRGMTSLRTRLYEILAAARTDTVAGLRRGDVLARVGADVDAVGDLVVRSLLPIAVAAVLGLSTSLGVALVFPPAGVILAVCLLLSGVAGPLVTIRSARAAELARQEQATDLSAAVMNLLDGADELRVSGRMPRAMSDLAGLEAHLAATRDRAARPAALAAVIDTTAMGLAVLGNILVGAPAVADGRLAPVWLAVIVLVPLSAFEASAALGPASVQLVTSAGAAVRIVDLLDDAAASAARVPTPRPLPAASASGPRLRARGLAVGWPGGPVLVDGVDLDLAPGRRLAVVGPSGIGKTTLLLTLAGLLEPRAGELTLDGAPPWGAERAETAARVSLTAEDAHVFDTTVLENLRVADGALTRERAAALLARAGLGDWLARLPDGLDTRLGAGATAVSGGERRRLLLARALAAPAPLMLLDEPGEHLDAATADRLVGDLLHAGTAPAPAAGPEASNADATGPAAEARGVLLVTHRLSALADADEVLILGRPHAAARPDETGGFDGTDDSPAGTTAVVTRRGTHAHLTAVDPDYRWSLQQEQETHV